MLSSMDQRVATLQFDGCAEKDRLCGRVSRDGLNVTCLDQCHGVCVYGASTSQGWRKRSMSLHLHPCFRQR